MWGNSTKRLKADNVETIIGQNTEITGDLTFRGGLHVDGRVKGNIWGEDDPESILILSQDGVIEGEVRVPNVMINGQVIGDVHASDRVELNNRARIEGNVYYNLLEMEMGAAINGNLVHEAKKEKRLLEYQKKPDSDVKIGTNKD
ncbi:MAG: polymer-forming cytoskeletal protein [Enterobacterales bacterium]|nr:polymer-forming cytoskeletal protein [Enterobacterales bacterium]